MIEQTEIEFQNLSVQELEHIQETGFDELRSNETKRFINYGFPKPRFNVYLAKMMMTILDLPQKSAQMEGYELDIFRKMWNQYYGNYVEFFRGLELTTKKYNQL